MTLSIIEMRLKVFPQYLEYRIDYIAKHMTDSLLVFTWCYTFNEWLFFNNYSNLIL
jgi:hypothetical protein